jgi:phosphatidylethanolamine N-methyltransferase
MYGQRKLIAKREPVRPPKTRGSSASGVVSSDPVQSAGSQTEDGDSESLFSNPLHSEDSSATEVEGDTELELDEDLTLRESATSKNLPEAGRSRSKRSSSQTLSRHGLQGSVATRKRPLSEHDLRNKYFRRDMVFLRHFDPLRYVLSL